MRRSKKNLPDWQHCYNQVIGKGVATYVVATNSNLKIRIKKCLYFYKLYDYLMISTQHIHTLNTNQTNNQQNL